MIIIGFHLRSIHKEIRVTCLLCMLSKKFVEACKRGEVVLNVNISLNIFSEFQSAVVDNLKVHMQVHSKQRYFQCSVLYLILRNTPEQIDFNPISRPICTVIDNAKRVLIFGMKSKITLKVFWNYLRSLQLVIPSVTKTPTHHNQCITT